MIYKVIKITLCVCSVILLSSCFKLQVNPEGVVEDTVSAGKSLYKTIKHRRDGTEERLYTHTVELLPDADVQQAGNECTEYLTESMNSGSDNDPQILESSTEIITGETGNKLKCSILAVL